MDVRRLLRGLTRVVRRTASAARICYLRACYRGLAIGFDSVIGPGCDIQVGRGGRVLLRGVVVGRGCQIVAGPGATIDIAADSIGPHSVIVARDRITIGAGTLLAEMVVVRDSDHARLAGAPLADLHHRSAPVSVGRDVWLAARATVLRGVSIGDGATVGATAVVTHDVPAAATVAGVPARPLRPREHATIPTTRGEMP
jgi:acetyltransferase-like isoleucine patch superfamily enzyme